MKKWMNIVQNLAIATLVVLCIVQTMQLWYNGYSNRSFLSAFFSSDSEYSASDALAGLVRPYRIVAPQDDMFTVLYGNAERAKLRTAGDSVLTQVMRSGEYVSAYALNEAALFASGGVWYEYAVPIPSDAFGLFYQARAGLLTNRFRSFNRIAMLPHGENGDSVRVVFVDDAARICYEYSVRRTGLGSDISAALEALPLSALHYRAAAVSGGGSPQTALYADWGDGALPYQQLRTYSPFGEITIPNVERIVVPFFETPSGVMWDVDSSVYTYKDSNAVAKYYPNDMLEFTNYTVHHGTITNSFASAYVAAANLLAKDKGVVNEYYLSSYEPKNDGWILTFDYIVNGFPVYMSQSLSLTLAQNQLNAAPMTHMIEVEVQSDRVYKYRRYGLAFEVETAALSHKQTGFTQTLENATEGIAPAADAALPLRSVLLGYRADGASSLSLQWLIVDESGMPLPSYN